MSNIVELEHIPVDQGKQRALKASTQALNIPSYKPELDGRWRAVQTKDYSPDPDMEWLVKEILKLAPTLNDITTQRAIYYMLRGKFPGKTFRGNEIAGDKFYGQFTAGGMEKVQLAANLTMQSMGIWAAPKGYIAGDGTIITNRRGRIPLTAQPTLNFDLADYGTRLNSNARKVIHFEKDAGFGSIVSGDMPKYIEAMFSTSQGQLTEAANKFLREAENWGLQIYSIHDADPFGIQMTLLYGLASKSNCYMSDEFFPKEVKSLGFFPSIANQLKLPPEKIEKDSGDHKLFNYLEQITVEKPDITPEVEIVIRTFKKWEFQALNAIDEKAPQIYIVESLRVKGDEIKHVPDGDIIKKQALQVVKDQAESVKEQAIRRAINQALEEVREQIETEIRASIADKVSEFDLQVQDMLDTIGKVDPKTFREAVKAELVNNPADYWDTAAVRVANRSSDLQFEVDADVEVVAEVKEVTTTSVAKATPPAKPETELVIDDIVAAIEKRIIRQAPNRVKVVDPIRKAFETVFGEPDQTW